MFEPDDYRNVRFNNATRYVNKNWGTVNFYCVDYKRFYCKICFFNCLFVCIFIGINLVDEIPPKECTERVVYCDGGDPHLGHPKVYINLVSTIAIAENCIMNHIIWLI